MYIDRPPIKNWQPVTFTIEAAYYVCSNCGLRIERSERTPDMCPVCERPVGEVRV